MSEGYRAAFLKNGFRIRIPYERWVHITESHDNMAGQIDLVVETLEDPDYVIQGGDDEIIALKEYHFINSRGTYLVVVYKNEENGFVITSFMTTKPKKIMKRGIIWKKSPEK
jgi:hypothetical protein